MLRRPIPRHNRGRIHAPSGDSPHPALAYGGIFAWELSDPGVELNGSDVSKVPNLLNPGTYDLVQGTASAQPAYEATGWNGVSPSMLGDGVAEYAMSNSLGPVFSDSAAHWIAIAYQIAASDTGDLWAGGNGSASSQFQRFTVRGGDYRGWCRNDDTSTSFQDFSAAAPNGSRHVAVYRQGSTVDLHLDGAADAGFGNSISGGTCTLDTFTVLAVNNAGVSQYLNARIGAMWGGLGAISAADAVAITDAMVARGYGYA